MKVGVDDIFVALGRIFRVTQRPVSPPFEPVRMLLEPWMIQRTLDGEIQRYFHTVPAGREDERVEIVEAAQFRMDGIVPARGCADCVWTAGVARSRLQGIIPALSVGLANGMN